MSELLVKIDTCPMCGEADYKQIADRPYYECLKCGMIWQSPILPPHLLDVFYATDAYHDTRGMSAPEIDMNEVARASRIARYIGLGDSILDIGCARGYLLQEAVMRGYKRILGVEPHPTFTFDGIPTVRHIDDVEGQWQVITAIHVLEHILDIKHMAERIKALLAPGGLLVVEVPNISAGGCFTDAHLNIMSMGVLSKLFSPLRVELQKLTPHTFMTFREVKDG